MAGEEEDGHGDHQRVLAEGVRAPTSVDIGDSLSTHRHLADDGRGGKKKTFEVHLRRKAPDTVVNSVLAGGKAVSDGDVSFQDHVIGANEGQSVKSYRTKYNRFNCDAIAGKGNGKMYTDTDSGGRTEIITHIAVKSHASSHRSQQLEVKVDPGAESNCMPLRHFRTMFPDWCDSTGRLKQGILRESEAELEAYNGGAISILGWVALHLQHIERPDKWIPARFYIIDRQEEDCRTLISHSTSAWTGLIEVKCKNSAPYIKGKYSLNLGQTNRFKTLLLKMFHCRQKTRS